MIPSYKFVKGAQDNIQISGTIRRVTHWGPPNFGENPKTDSKFQSWMLELDAPLTVLVNASSGDKDSFSKINLVMEPRNAELEMLRGKHVRIIGNLIKPEIVPYQDVTVVSLIVSSIRISPEIICRAKQAPN